MPNKPTPEQLDAIVRELREAEQQSALSKEGSIEGWLWAGPNDRYRSLCVKHMPAILDALEAVIEELPSDGSGKQLEPEEYRTPADRVRFYLERLAAYQEDEWKVKAALEAKDAELKAAHVMPDNLQVKADTYDYVCEKLGTKDHILGVVRNLQKELKAARAAIGYYGPNPTKGHGACCECTVCTYLAKYGEQGGKG